VPVDADGNFSMAFFTNFGVHGQVGLLDWYTVSIAIFAATILAAHGATYLTLKTEGPVHDRSSRFAAYLWAAAVPLFVVISIESSAVRHEVVGPAVHNPFCWLGVFILLIAAGTMISGLTARHEMRAFLGSNFILVGLLTTGGGAIFPVMLYSTLAPQNSMTAYSSAAGEQGLRLASFWWPVAFALAVIYFIFISRRYTGKVSVRRDTQGYY
jgi:cytochrome d ubiquinol oxidase subunit II